MLFSAVMVRVHAVVHPLMQALPGYASVEMSSVQSRYVSGAEPFEYDPPQPVTGQYILSKPEGQHSVSKGKFWLGFK
jgi:hypothetical protein